MTDSMRYGMSRRFTERLHTDPIVPDLNVYPAATKNSGMWNVKMMCLASPLTASV